MRRTCLAVALVSVLLVPLTAAPAVKSPRRKPTSSTLLNQRAALNTRAAAARRQLSRIKQQQAAVTQDLHVVEKKVRLSREQLHQATTCLQDTRQQLTTATQRLGAAKDRLAQHQSQLAERLRFMYEHGQTGYLSVLTRAADFSDFADRYYLLGQIARQDVEILEQVRRAKEEVASHRAAVASKEHQVSDWQTRVASRHDAYQISRQEKQRVLAYLAVQRRRYEIELAATERARRQIDSLIRALARTPGGRRRYLTPWRGSFANPVPGARITSGYGYRVHPIYHVRAFHHGVDLAAPQGSPIRAAGAGEVILAAAGGTGYGRYIVVDHGGGVTTLYAHCSRFAVGVGARVAKGQTIAYVGSTGSSTGPHCHFEVRRQGSTISPM